jgi:hypothetical protein
LLGLLGFWLWALTHFHAQTSSLKQRGSFLQMESGSPRDTNACQPKKKQTIHGYV